LKFDFPLLDVVIDPARLANRAANLLAQKGRNFASYSPASVEDSPARSKSGFGLEKFRETLKLGDANAFVIK
jgi:hypothetical protein